MLIVTRESEHRPNLKVDARLAPFTTAKFLSALALRGNNIEGGAMAATNFSRLQIRHKPITRMAFRAFLAVCISLLPLIESQLPGQAAPSTPVRRNWVYSLSQKQETSDVLKIWGVPACAAVNGANPKGTYVTGLTGYGLAEDLKLEVGDVLLSINGRVMTSAKDADRILNSMKAGDVKAVVARQANGRVFLLQPHAMFYPKVTESASSGSSSGAGSGSNSSDSQDVDVTAKSRANGNGMYSSSYTAARESKKAAVSNETMAGLESYMFELINSDRQKNGQSKIRMSARLSQVARQFAQDMATRNFFDHTDPNGGTPHSRAQMAGLNCRVFENISVNYGPLSWKDMIKGAQAEMMSEPANNPHNHRGNILNSDHAVVGVGMAVVMPNKIYCVQEFSNDEVP
jgi:uncharacterized protein YkwD